MIRDNVIYVKCTQKEKDKLEKYSEENEITMSEIVRQALREFLKNG